MSSLSIRRKVRIRDLGRVVTGKTPSTASPENFGSDYPFLTPTDMHGSKWARMTERGLSLAGTLTIRGQLPAGAVAVSCIGWQMGKAILTDRPTYTNQQINSIIPNSGVDAEYLYYHFATRRDELLSIGSAGGVRTPIISKSSFEALEVELPGHGIQRDVASILSGYDDLIENNTRRIAILDEMARRIYEEWFVRFRFPGHEGVRMVESESGLVPEGWPIMRLDEAFKFGSGKPISKTDREVGGVPVYGANGVIGSTALAPLSSRCVVLGKIGSCGAIHRPIEPCYVTNNAFFVEPRTAQGFEVMELTLRAVDYKPYIGGAANPYMPLPSFGHHPIVRPTADVERKFNDVAAPMFTLQRTLRRHSENLRTTRDLLLPKLISGELDVSAMPEPGALAA